MTTKERWEQAEIVARVLGISKSAVFNAGVEMDRLIPDILAGDEEAIAQAKALKWYGKPQRQEPRVYHPKIKKKSKVQSKADELRLMLWAIDKIGDLNRAEKAFQAAKIALSD